MPSASESRRVLLVERDALIAQLSALEHDFEVLIAASAGVATDDEHDPEGATIAFERAQVDALRAQLRRHLGDLEAALAGLAEGRYGICERCGSLIASERLAARPAARRCITCAEDWSGPARRARI